VTRPIPNRQSPSAHRAPIEGKQRRNANGPAKVAEPSKGETRTKVAAALGISHVTYTRAKAVAAAAERNPKRFADLVERMDASGKVNTSYTELVRRQNATAGNRPMTVRQPPVRASGPQSAPPCWGMPLRSVHSGTPHACGSYQTLAFLGVT